VIQRFYASGPLGVGMSPAGDLDIAEPLSALGRAQGARLVLERYVDRPTLRTHATYLAEHLPTIGQPDLVPRTWTGPPAGVP
jgi:hypothetical protein